MYNELMQKIFAKSSFATSAALGFLFLIPFIVLEIVNRWEFQEGFPWAVFIFTWILQTLFIFIALPLIRSLQAGKSLRKNIFNTLFRIVGMVFIAYIWGGWIIDQWPCLMGVPNCD